MNDSTVHLFHIPVLGICYSIDTPLKVARFGISSVLSIMDDHLVEQIREYHSLQAGKPYEHIAVKEDDHRARRVTAYLDLLHDLVAEQVEALKREPFTQGSEICRYFEMLPDRSSLKSNYVRMMSLEDGPERELLQAQLREAVRPGSIDVNVMAKIDKMNVDLKGNLLPPEFSDALAAFRGFAASKLHSSIVFSAGYNPSLYNYVEQFRDFYPDENGFIKKKIILKVSDFRSALIQGKIMAKKGLWISEYRIESGLNCGGHAFPTDGLLLGPILEEFKNKKEELVTELKDLCNPALRKKGYPQFEGRPPFKVTVQGGIGTAAEQEFLLEYYEVDRTGWGSPFLLVPEATNVEEETLQHLATAGKDDYYLSNASPLGVAFNNFRKSSAEELRQLRIQRGRPGNPCYKKFLATDTEFTEEPICTASREYQALKIEQLKSRNLDKDAYDAAFQQIVEKDCLCEGLGSSILIKDHLRLSHNISSVTICPGPNLAYFSGIFKLEEMVSHIYGRINLLNSLPRPHMFINELQLYVKYFKDKLEGSLTPSAKQVKYLQQFRNNLLDGIDYYKGLVHEFKRESYQYINRFVEELEAAAVTLKLEHAVLIAAE